MNSLCKYFALVVLTNLFSIFFLTATAAPIANVDNSKDAEPKKMNFDSSRYIEKKWSNQVQNGELTPGFYGSGMFSGSDGDVPMMPDKW